MWPYRITVGAIIIYFICFIYFAFAEPLKRAVYVNGRSRTAIYFVDEKGLHTLYFTDNSNQFLGEEIFKNGEKIFDTYKENDGARD